jgi:hypothetical protein
MKYYLLSYSIKVWLTTVFVAPFILGIIDYLYAPRYLNIFHEGIDSLIQSYLFVLLTSGILSIFLLLIFWGIAALTCLHTTNMIHRKLIVSFMGIILTALTFLFLFSCLFSYNDAVTDIPLTMMFSYAFCIAGGCWFYNLGSKT